MILKTKQVFARLKRLKVSEYTIGYGSVPTMRGGSICFNVATVMSFYTVNPSYLNCIVCEEWLTFSNFITWMEQQDHEGKHLDKDLLYNGNKIYSPETCVFVDQRTNKFVLEKAGKVSPYPVGVYFEKARQKYVAECTDPFGVNGKFIGRFDTPEEAHKAWQAKKHEYACMLADLQEDERVAKVLRTRYL